MTARLASRPLWLAGVGLLGVALVACGGRGASLADVDLGASDTHDGSVGSDLGGALDGQAAQPPLFVGTVVSVVIGDGGGFGSGKLPGVVEGPPKGGGESAGSTDVLSLGHGGSIVLDFDEDLIDRPGDDLVIFENAFFVLGSHEHPFSEPAVVGVSSDGVTFSEWPCDPSPPYAGCAGTHPVFANADLNSLDPASLAGGGDRFDLADLGITRARYVRIRDAGLCCNGASGTAGFDLDAVALINHAPRP